MKQIPAQKFVSEDGKFIIVCDDDFPLGAMHDCLMYLKGFVVDKMNKAQIEEKAASDKIKEIDKAAEEITKVIEEAKEEVVEETK